MLENKSSKDLCADFEAECKSFKEKAKPYLDEAMAALQKVVDLSEETGIPFHSSISELPQSYSPSTYRKWFGKFEEFENGDELYNKIANIWSLENGMGFGWEHSAVCY